MIGVLPLGHFLTQNTGSSLTMSISLKLTVALVLTLQLYHALFCRQMAHCKYPSAVCSLTDSSEE